MMKSILLITPHLPYAKVGHAGGKAIYDFIVQLHKKNIEVFLISLVLPEEVPFLDEIKRLASRHYFLVSQPVFTNDYLSFLRRHPFLFFLKLPRALVKHMGLSLKLNRAVSEMIVQCPPDVVQVEYSSMALYLRSVRAVCLRILHLHDVMHKPAYRIYRAQQNPLVKMGRYLGYLLIRYAELRFCGKFDLLLTKSEIDRDLLLKKNKKFSVRVFPLGIEPMGAFIPREDREEGSILFLGAMYREVNENAAVFFIQEVMPALRKRLSRVTFCVAGSGPSRQLREYAGKDIVITGFVDDPAVYLRRCMVFVAPLFVGGGMIYKVIQAMSFGLPVVSSSIANEGVRAVDGESVLLADDAEAICDKVVALCQDGELWNRIARNGKRHVEALFSWGGIMEDYLRWCAEHEKSGM